MGRIIGIDLGTTNCCMALLEQNRATVITLEDGERTLPSVVAIGKGGEHLVGHAARRQAAVHPERTIYGAKRLIGRKFEDPRIQRWHELVPYRIVAADSGDAHVEVDGRIYSPEEISAILLRDLKRQAEAFLGEAVSSATITVPAYFNDRQRQATRNAGEIAGLQVEHILNEPTAAALAYGASQGGDEKLAVFDLGGGTFDITILEKTGGLFEVRSTHGDTFLGGEDVDQRVVDYLVEHFLEETMYDLTTNPSAMLRVKEAAEIAKRELSSAESTSVKIPFLVEYGGRAMHLDVEELTRRNLELLCLPVLKRLDKPCLSALSAAHMEPGELDRVLLAGGMTRMPAVQHKVRQIFEKRASHVINPDEIVAIGAAAQCGIISGELEGVTLLDVTPHSLGVRVWNDEMRVLIPKNSSVPTSEEHSFTTTYDFQDSVKIELFQGEGRRILDNTPLGEFRLTDLPRAEQGKLEIVVTFMLDADGLLEVSAVERQSGRRAAVEISPSGGLTPREVEKLKQSHQ